jgi:hypothetical protein
MDIDGWIKFKSWPFATRPRVADAICWKLMGFWCSPMAACEHAGRWYWEMVRGHARVPEACMGQPGRRGRRGAVLLEYLPRLWSLPRLEVLPEVRMAYVQGLLQVLAAK